MIHWRTKADYQVECLDCEWRCYASNGMAAGANHSRNNGHIVRVEQTRAYIFGEAHPGDGFSDKVQKA